MLYWSVGKRVREEVLGGERAEYGQRAVKRLGERLTARYGRGWSRRNIERMMHLAGWLPDSEKCATLSPKLSWSHLTELLTITELQKRDFYAAFAVHERWSVRTLRAKIAGKLYERSIAARGSAVGLEADLATILCTEKGPEQVALLGLDSGEVRAAQYVTDEVRAGLERIAARAKELEA